MMNILTPKMAATFAVSADTVTVDGKVIAVSTLSPDVQASLIILREWQAQHKLHQLEANKLQRAITSLQHEIGTLLGAAQPSPEPPQTQEG